MTRRLLCMTYELLVVAALLLVGSLLALLWLPGGLDGVSGVARVSLQLWLLLVVGGYFVLCWSRFGQTLAMRAWRLHLTTSCGSALPGPLRASARWILAALLLPASIMWALLDRERLFLHDRLAGTRVGHLPAATRS